MTGNFYDLRLNGVPVVFSIGQETEPGEGWNAYEYFGFVKTDAELVRAISKYHPRVNLHWQLKIELQECPDCMTKCFETSNPSDECDEHKMLKGMYVKD